MASKQEIKDFDSRLTKEVDILSNLITEVKSAKTKESLAKAIKLSETQQYKVRILTEQSKVFGDWTMEGSDYLPSDKKFKYTLPLLALVITLFIIR